MLLKLLLKDFLQIKDSDNIEVSGLCSDSRSIKDGDLFIAYPGNRFDGRKFLKQAIDNGSAAIICEKNGFCGNRDLSVPIIFISDLQNKISEIAARFYNYPSRDMRIIGVTGTNGKTSCSHFLAQALTNFGISCGVAGTLGVGFLNDLQIGINTTPDPVLLQSKLNELRIHGAKVVAMEASSQGLAQNRVAGIDFEIAIFTNLSRDHLDYHKDMKNYADAKRKLFQQENLRKVIINADDHFGRELIEELQQKIEVIGYSVTKQKLSTPIVRAQNIITSENGCDATVITPWGEGRLKTRLLGRFNIGNLLAVLAALNFMDIPFDRSLELMETIKSVNGRMETFAWKKHPLVVVDYAHTPDALDKTLTVLREHCRGLLWTVFGCGGDRDRGKRSLMGSIAERLSDHIIITDDNPRSEDSLKIIDDIQQGLICPWAAEIEPDRASAIAHALDCANPRDIVLIAGKGHEKYQIIGDEKIYFNDAVEVKRCIMRDKYAVN